MNIRTNARRMNIAFRQKPNARKADNSARAFGTYNRLQPYGGKVTPNR